MATFFSGVLLIIPCYLRFFTKIALCLLQTSPEIRQGNKQISKYSKNYLLSFPCYRRAGFFLYYPIIFFFVLQDEEKLKNTNRDLTLVKMKSMFAIGKRKKLFIIRSSLG